MTHSSNRAMLMLFLCLLCVLASAGCAQAGPDGGSSSSPDAGATAPKAAPELRATDQDGNEVDLAELYAAGPVLVYFYPKADTPGCTAQACSLRDSYELLTDRGVSVVGVSGDSVEAQSAFREKHNLPFTLIADPDGNVMEAFGVPNRMGLASRQAFLVRDGTIVWHDDSASTDRQAADVLEVLESWGADS